MKATITAIQRKTQDQDGNAYIGKNGQPYTRLLIQCTEKPSVTLSGFDGKDTKEWKEGSVVEILEEERKVGDKIYWNFRVPSKLELRVKKLEDKVFGTNENTDAPPDFLGE